jgi:hypothetical protein
MSKFLLIITFLLPVQIFAQLEGNPENWCRNGAFLRENSEYQLAKITGQKGKRVYFYKDDDDCPNGKNCRMKSYLIPNNEIIVSRKFGNWACSWFQPIKGSETVGWISLDNISFQPSNNKPLLTKWIGKWEFYENTINLKKSKKTGFLTIKGSAFWKGLGDNIHIGELDDESKPEGNNLKIGENSTGQYDCKVNMFLLGKYLIVSDNLNCGGANVSFSGVYRKKAR